MFPAGTVLGELLFQVDSSGEWFPFEIRTRVRRIDGWSSNVFRPFPTAEDFARELERLKLSIQAGAKLGGCVEGGKRTIALVHYPPRYTDGRETGAVELLKSAHVDTCVYGHLHGKDHKYGFQGEADGITYYLASVDAIDFKPIPIP